MDLNLQITSSKSKKLLVRIAAIVLAAALALSGVTPSFAEEISLSATVDLKGGPKIEGTSAIMMDAGSGMILYQKDPHKKREVASVTKMMTCLVVLEELEMDQVLTVDYPVPNEESNMGLTMGEELTVEQLLYALMVSSANDAAEFLAVKVGGSVKGFAKMMNEKAVECGAKNTHFNNPNGLNDENNTTTAYDLAMIAREAMKNPDFRKIVSTKSYTIPANEYAAERKMKNTNACLEGSKVKVEIAGVEKPLAYEGNKGIKTGWTTPAGQCFCGWSEREGTQLVTVVLNSETTESKFVDSIKLWDYGFENFYTHTAAEAGKTITEVRVRHGKDRRVEAVLAEDADVTLNEGYDSENITIKIRKLEEKPKAPVKKGDTVAFLQVYKEEQLVSEAPLIAAKDVDEGGLFSWIPLPSKETMRYIGLILLTLIVLIIVRMLYVQSRRKRRLRRKAKRSRKAKRRSREREKNPFV